MSEDNIGEAGENTQTVELVNLLRRKGFSDASFEHIFKILDPITRKQTTRKPDVVFSNGGVNLISAKIGEDLERKAVSSAYSYLRELASVTSISEVFAVTYPKKKEKCYHLHVLPIGEREEISLVFTSMESLATSIAHVVNGRIAFLEGEQETTEHEARRILQYTAYELADSLSEIPVENLETVFGGHDFFRSVFQKSLKADERERALRIGTAFLFINQILFYILLSQSAKKSANPEVYPEIQQLDKSDPAVLQEKYFDKVRAKDYEPIYGHVLTQYFNSSKVGVQLSELIDTITVLLSKLQVSELVGQIFQSLIPFQIRKPLGAHYTNPNAAQLLASVAIKSFEDNVIDPSCGSGTLLVAAYKQKAKIAPKINPDILHKQFLEKDITGIDAMAFSSHLAAVNLALQQPLMETDYVRIGTEDSTRHRPGDIIQPTSDRWTDELTQAKISHQFSEKNENSQIIRIPSLNKSKAKPIELKQADVVLMNPPFTSQNNLSKDYKDSLKNRFSIPLSHKKTIYWKTSQQLYFILLADRFLKKKGTMAAVLPFTTFTGHAFHELVKFLVGNYTIKAIVVGLGQSSFSEDTSLTECLFVAVKERPKPDHKFLLVGTKVAPTLWTEDLISQLSKSIQNSEELSSDNYCSKMIPQNDLLPDSQTLVMEVM